MSEDNQEMSTQMEPISVIDNSQDGEIPNFKVNIINQRDLGDPMFNIIHLN